VEDTHLEPLRFDGFAGGSGLDAAVASESTGALAGSNAPPQIPDSDQEGGVKVVGNKSFFLRDGTWKDVDYHGTIAYDDFLIFASNYGGR
jgi:hypothetical protein